MIDKQIARKLLPLVNDPVDMKLIGEYITFRLDLLRLDLENATDMNSILRTQGQIKELKRLLNLRDEVLQDAIRE